MKKILLSVLSLFVTITMFAQGEAVRKMRVVYDGEVLFSRNVAMIDSVKFVWSDLSDGDDIVGEGGIDSTKQLYVGVVAFNRDILQMPITSDVEAVKTFINEQNNDKDATAFAYAVSKGNLLFDNEALPVLDNIFMLSFSDGTDNYSQMRWGEEGRIMPPNAVYDTAQYDLMQRAGLNSYAMAFGDDSKFGNQMKKIVLGSGGYYNAKASSDLQYTFNEIAYSMLASAKNLLIQTNPGYYYGFYKYFRLTFTSETGHVDTVYTQMEGIPSTGYTLTINRIANNYASFEAPARGEWNKETGKVHISLNKMKFVKDGEELQYKVDIAVSFDGEYYYEDVEEASASEEINKRIAVVLVLDCSTSMGEAFDPMKSAAVDFIETLEAMELDSTRTEIPDVDVVWHLNGGVLAEDISLPWVVEEDYTIPVPTREGYAFAGWCDKASGEGEKYTTLPAGWTGTLYAIWTDIVLPSITTITTSVNSTYAIIGGKITDDGGGAITECGVVYSKLPNPTVEDNKVGQSGRTGEFTCTLLNLDPDSTYYARAYAKNYAGLVYGEEVTFKTPLHEFVDLGLSVKWATCNIGAKNPEDFGYYYAWGETTTKNTYDWTTYKYCRGIESSMTKYCTKSSYGTVDNKTTLELTDDAARANWGDDWRMPTQAEWNELQSMCTWTSTTINGVKGYKVTSKKNGNYIFLPAAGYRSNSGLIDVGVYWFYWSSSLYTSRSSCAVALLDDEYDKLCTAGITGSRFCHRFYGKSVRPVCP